MVKKSTLAFFVLTQYRSVTDRQMDIPPLAIPAVCIARYTNALVKSRIFLHKVPLGVSSEKITFSSNQHLIHKYGL